MLKKTRMVPTRVYGPPKDGILSLGDGKAF